MVEAFAVKEGAMFIRNGVAGGLNPSIDGIQSGTRVVVDCVNNEQVLIRVEDIPVPQEDLNAADNSVPKEQLIETERLHTPGAVGATIGLAAYQLQKCFIAA